MSEPRLISPLLDGFAIGGAISDHHGVRCYPAMEDNKDDRYIVKIISVPASQSQLDALLLTGAYPDAQSASSYFQEVADGIMQEVDVLNQLAKMEGFLPYLDCQFEPMEDGQTGFEIYLLSHYKRTLARQFVRNPLTHLAALNLGLDLCAALSVCRRAGYLYVDLKPSNVFVTEEGEYRIGDLGFVPLDSLRYASLPEKYRSAYTPPEVEDAFSTLNTTIDTYAVGQILYQAYNNGELPVLSEGGELQPPMYADYEMAEIILKAIHPDAEQRWEDPAQLGQALVSYMQRNGANDTPIVPPVPALSDEELEDVAVQIAESAPAEEISVETSEQTEANKESDLQEEETPAEDEDFENLSFLEGDDLPPEDADVPYSELSEEANQILEQVDVLAEHPVPAPVVAPEPIEVTLPEPEPEPEEEKSSQDDADADAQMVIAMDDVGEDSAEMDDPESAPKDKKRRWVWLVAGAIALIGLLTAGIYFFRNYYLIPIDAISVSGKEDSLTVMVDTDVDESLLMVVCSDSHGNQFTAPVENGQAVITGLIPDTGYNVKVVVNGFHYVSGDSSTAYSTPPQTNIVQFNAVTGAEEGSVILGFTIDGPDCRQWSITYSAEGEEEKTVSFPSHMYTLNGLTLGKEYTFHLKPDTDLYLSGNDTIVHTPGKLVFADKLVVQSCVNNTLAVTWVCPVDTEVSGWTVRCYNESGTYNETVHTEHTATTFTGLDHTGSYVIEVTADGMSVSQRAYVQENSMTVTNMQTDATQPGKLVLSWDSPASPKEGWLLTYTVDGSDVQNVTCIANTAVISPVIPGAVYSISLQEASGTQILGGTFDYTPNAAETFTCSYGGYTVSAEDMTFSMCKTPSSQNWNRYYLSSSDYTTNFKVGQKASFLVKLNKSYGTSTDIITTLYVIRDSAGKVVSIASKEQRWTDMWYLNYCELDIPALPSVAGNYSVTVFFDGGLAATQNFKVI